MEKRIIAMCGTDTFTIFMYIKANILWITLITSPHVPVDAELNRLMNSRLEVPVRLLLEIMVVSQIENV